MLKSILPFIAGIVFNASLQVGLCRSMGSFVELKNRLVLGTVLFVVLVWVAKYFADRSSKRESEPSKALRFFWVFSGVAALLSPAFTVFYPSVHLVQGIVLVAASAVAGIAVFGVEGFFERSRRTFARGLEIARRHVLFLFIVPVFFLVFLCEVNDQWDVYEADAPYYGHFARNILRYDLTYTWLLRTHGTGDVAQPKNANTHNLRHPSGYIIYLTAWYLVVGSDLPRPAERMLPLLSNFLFLLMLYLFVLKKTGTRTVAVCAGLIYIFIPISSTFAGKVAQLSMMHVLLLFCIIVYDKLLEGSRTAVRDLMALCALTLFTDWYATFFWPLIWADYGVRYLRDNTRYRADPLYLIPAACAVSCAAIFGQMALGGISFGSLKYVANLRFNADYVKQFTLENFNDTLVVYLVRDYTGILYQVGVLWPLLFVVRAVRRRVDRLDIFTLVALVYALINIYLFQKIFIHYFEVIHFLLYAVLSGTAVLRYAYPWIRRMGASGGMLMISLVVLTMLPDTVDGIRYFRLRHSGAYTDGYAEAAEFVRSRIQRHESVITNRTFNVYSNERHIVGNHTVQCNTPACFKKAQENEDAAFAILFEKPSDAPMFRYAFKQGSVRVFHDRVAVIELKKPKNLFSKLQSHTEKNNDTQEETLINDRVMLLGARLPEIVELRRRSFGETYFTSLNEDKFPELSSCALDIYYTYRIVDPVDDGLLNDEGGKNRSQVDASWHTEIRDAAGRTVQSAQHPLTQIFYRSKLWPKNKAVNETVTAYLPATLPPGEYQVFVCSTDTEIALGHFYLGRSSEDIQRQPTSDTPQISIDREILPGFRLVGADFSARTVSPGETLRIDTFYRKQREASGAVSPVIRIRDVQGGDLSVTVYPEPLPLIQQGKTYRYWAALNIPSFAGGGVKRVFLEANGSEIELGTIEIISERIPESVLAEGSEPANSPSKASGRQLRGRGISRDKEGLQIRFNAGGGRPVQLLLEAQYAEAVSGYTVVADIRNSSHNGGHRQRILSDIVEKTLLSKESYYRAIEIPRRLVKNRDNLLLIKPLQAGRIERTYPLWRNVLLKLISPTLRWLLRTDLSSELPQFTYIAVEAGR